MASADGDAEDGSTRKKKKGAEARKARLEAEGGSEDGESMDEEDTGAFIKSEPMEDWGVDVVFLASC